MIANGGALAPVAGERLAAPFVELRDLTRRRHKSLARRAKRLDAIGPTALVNAQAPTEREEWARRAFALKRDWLKRKGLVSAGLSSPISEEFIAALARDGFLRVHALRVGREIAALDLGFVAGGAYRSLLGCYDARFAEGSPGQSLTSRLVARCAEEGLSRYDLLAPADPYKLAWATGETRVEAQFLAKTIKGRIAAFALARLRPIAKRALRTLGPRIAAKLRSPFLRRLPESEFLAPTNR